MALRIDPVQTVRARPSAGPRLVPALRVARPRTDGALTLSVGEARHLAREIAVWLARHDGSSAGSSVGAAFDLPRTP